MDSAHSKEKKEKKSARRTKKRLPESKQRRAIYRLISNLLLWALVCGLLSILFFVLEDVTNTGRQYIRFSLYGSPEWRGGWAAELSIFVTILGFNLATTDVLRHYVRHHGRNVVSWITASIVFTPILAGVVYLLTWPKGTKLTGLD